MLAIVHIDHTDLHVLSQSQSIFRGFNRMFSCFRSDLEVVRTMADQMRRREKLRKRDLGAWQSGLQQHLRAAVTAPPHWDQVWLPHLFSNEIYSGITYMF